MAGVGDLVVVLDEGDATRGRDVETRPAAAIGLPGIELPLEQEAVFGRGDELLRDAGVIAVVGLPPPGHRDDCRMVEVVVPHRVDAVAALLRAADQAGVLRLVLTY